MNIKHALTALALTATIGLSTAAPAKADGAASTRNIIFGATALLAGIAIESNVAHKNAQANTVQGYLQDGSTVYADGYVVDRNGNGYYPGNNGQQVACNNDSCAITNQQGYYGNYHGSNNGNYTNYGDPNNAGNNGYYQNAQRRYGTWNL